MDKSKALRRKLEEEQNVRRLSVKWKGENEPGEALQDQEKMIASLLDDAENWQKSNILQNFIEEVCVREKEGRPIPFIKGNVDEWLKWANYHAERLDPFSLSSKAGTKQMA